MPHVTHAGSCKTCLKCCSCSQICSWPLCIYFPWLWNSLWPSYNSLLAFWRWKRRCRTAEQKVCQVLCGHLCLSEQGWADKGCRHRDHFTSKPVFNSPNSPKIAGAQSFTTGIKKPPKYGLVAGKVKENRVAENSSWKTFISGMDL